MLGSVFRSRSPRGPAHTPEELETAIDAELEKFRTAGPDAAEVERARNVFETRIVNGLERSADLAASPIASTSTTTTSAIPDTSRRISRAIARRRRQSVKAFAAKYLTTNARVVVFGVPGEKNLGAGSAEAAGADWRRPDGGSVNADEAWRSTKPEAGRPRR